MSKRASRRVKPDQSRQRTQATARRRERSWWPVLVLLAMLVVLWIRLVPMARPEQELRYRGDDGHQHVYLGDYDSYVWLRNARNYLRTGSTCDAVINGECRDTYDHAPVGAEMVYNRSLHIAAIVAVHRLITTFVPGFPLPASAYFVPVIVGVLGVLPAFGIGWRLAGPLAGLAAALLVGVNPLFLQRSIGSDNDVWNLVLPLFMMWATLEALRARTAARQAGCAVLAALAVGLHAATWSGWTFGCAVVLAGLLSNVGVQVLRALRRRSWRAWQVAEVRGALLTLLAFYVAAALFVAIAGRGSEYFELPLQVVGRFSPGTPALAPVPESAAYWPSVLSTVSELAVPNLGRIARYMAGNVVFFIGWLGLLVLLLPRRDWRWWHFLLLIAGNYLYRYLLTADVSRLMLVELLTLPLTLTMALYAFADDDTAGSEREMGLLIAVWFLASIYLSYQGLRFIMLLVPPFAIAFGAAIGRLQQWVSWKLGSMSLSYVRPLQVAAWLALAAVLIQPVRQGYAAARAYVPAMNDAWWDTLTMLRDTTPTDTIVNTWWDFGYFAKYVAERRVSAAGASLQTHIPHWIGRALVASNERESVGLLRMLNCGSDATPLPEGREGAYGKLTADGFDGIVAHDVVVELARLDVDAADADLAARGLSESARADVLRSTHCTPPPSYLILSSNMIATSMNWGLLGNWDLRRAYLARHVHDLTETDMLARLTGRFGYGEDEAHTLYRQAAALPPGGERNFVSPPFLLLTRDWVACQEQSEGRLLCRNRLHEGRRGVVLDSVLYLPERAGESRLRFRQAVPSRRQPAVIEEVPAVVLIASDNGVSTLTPALSARSEFGLLVDPANARVLVGSPSMLASTFVRLMFLDGRGMEHFEKVSDRSSFGGQRVVTWRINWQGRQPR
jgi:asparagine N-glycosylation enzyme membrane subunit Stt3